MTLFEYVKQEIEISKRIKETFKINPAIDCIIFNKKPILLYLLLRIIN